MLSEPQTYTFIGEKLHSIFGRYDIGTDYICVKDDSLLDTQILLIDKNGEMHWEDYRNFQCNQTPVKVEITVRYHIDLCGDYRDYSYFLVWYKERTHDELKEEIIKDLTRRVSYEIEVLSIGVV